MDSEREPRPEDNLDAAYAAYHEAGGILSPEQYLAAVDVLRNGTDQTFLPHRQSQAEGMDGVTGSHLTAQETALYCFLRAQQSDSHGFTSLDDQPLMAEVLLVSRGAIGAGEFKSKYPSIFREQQKPSQ